MRNEESVEGYCVPLSVEAGERVSLHAGATRRLRRGSVEAASGELRYAVEIARLGAKREVVWRVQDLVAVPLPVPRDAFARGAGYPESLAIQTRGEVRYCLKGVGVGVEFVGISPESVQAIEDEIGVQKQST